MTEAEASQFQAAQQQNALYRDVIAEQAIELTQLRRIALPFLQAQQQRGEPDAAQEEG